MRTTIHKITLLVLLTAAGCYTIPKIPDIEKSDKDYYDHKKHDKDYYDYYGYDQIYTMAYIRWQNEQRRLRSIIYYDLFNHPVYQNHYPYYPSRNYPSRNYDRYIYDVYYNPVKNQNTQIIVHKEPPKNNSTIKRKVWKNRQNTSRVRLDSKMKPKPYTQQGLIAHQQVKQVAKRKIQKKIKPLTQQEIIAKQQVEMKKKKENK